MSDTVLTLADGRKLTIKQPGILQESRLVRAISNWRNVGRSISDMDRLKSGGQIQRIWRLISSQPA